MIFLRTVRHIIFPNCSICILNSRSKSKLSYLFSSEHQDYSTAYSSVIVAVNLIEVSDYQADFIQLDFIMSIILVICSIDSVQSKFY